jgi:hypothetical protein
LRYVNDREGGGDDQLSSVKHRGRLAGHAAVTPAATITRRADGL